ncbi:MAG: aminoacyl-tRNA hydrolase [Bacilli bacterium]|nr:aminoacyl-tRNA hydrolase [Bacilli bacterium]
MKLIVGLGNPGKEYKKTRHNVGFIIVDNYADSLKWNKDGDTLIANTIINDEKVLFIKPQTYMNLSGNSVGRIAKYYKIDPKDILVIHDDMDLPMMEYRIKFNSSSGGHNGIKSIISVLGTEGFARLKIGIGHNEDGDTKDFVLGKLSKKEISFMETDVFKDIINDFVNKDINYVMNKYN